jgi:hypothetical protein
MKLADLPPAVMEDLCQEDGWRLDIDPGLDAKHEFYLSWRHFLVLPEPRPTYYESSEADLADFLMLDGFAVLLPVARSHHPNIELIRLIPSADEQTLTLFLHDSYHESYFNDQWSARYGFLAIADRYQKFGCEFYLASYYHFSYLIGEDYKTAQDVMRRKLNPLD